MTHDNWNKPKSMCECGHSGDGPNSNHGDSPLVKGHGKCYVPGCSCKKFTWLSFYPHYEAYLDRTVFLMSERDVFKGGDA